MNFPRGSKPYMLRVSPDGKVVWVQTSGAKTNVVLDAESMETLHERTDGRDRSSPLSARLVVATES